MLAAREPVAPYIHMREIVSGKGLFQKESGWNEAKVNSLIFDAVNLLQGLPKSRFCTIACSIDVTGRERLILEGCEITKPEVICAQCCVGGGLYWYHEHLPDALETAYVFFDNNDRSMHELRQEWLRNRKPRKLVTDDLLWGLIADVKAVGMKDNAPLQAADMVAWAATRIRSDKVRPYRYLATVLQALVPNSRLVLDAETLREKYASC